MNYYIIGSKYGNQSEGFEDILPLMLKKGVIATGFNWNDDMSDYVGGGHGKIIRYLKGKNESKESYSTLKHVLNLKPGDLVAVKIHSAPTGKQARLVIGAYAIVKGTDAPIYQLCEELGHTIKVDFIESGLEYEVPFGYGQTIHKVEELERIKLIFGHYWNYETTSDYQQHELLLRNTDDVMVEASAGYVLSRTHNKIQNLLIIELIKHYDARFIKIEPNFIDVLVELEDKFILYEVKSSICPDRCIREALGQIIKYGHSLKNRSNKAIEYVIAGPSEIDSSDGSYYTYVVNIMREPFSYRRILC